MWTNDRYRRTLQRALHDAVGIHERQEKPWDQLPRWSSHEEQERVLNDQEEYAIPLIAEFRELTALYHTYIVDKHLSEAEIVRMRQEIKPFGADWVSAYYNRHEGLIDQYEREESYAVCDTGFTIEDIPRFELHEVLCLRGVSTEIAHTRKLLGNQLTILNYRIAWTKKEWSVNNPRQAM